MACLPLFRRLHELIGRHHVPGGLLHGTGAQVYGRHALEHCHCVVVYMIGCLVGWVGGFGLFFTFHFPSLPFTSLHFPLVLVQLLLFVVLSIELSMEICLFSNCTFLNWRKCLQTYVFKFINRFLNIWFSSFIYFLLLISFLFLKCGSFFGQTFALRTEAAWDDDYYY